MKAVALLNISGNFDIFQDSLMDKKESIYLNLKYVVLVTM